MTLALTSEPSRSFETFTTSTKQAKIKVSMSVIEPRSFLKCYPMSSEFDKRGGKLDLISRSIKVSVTRTLSLDLAEDDMVDLDQTATMLEEELVVATMEATALLRGRASMSTMLETTSLVQGVVQLLLEVK